MNPLSCFFPMVDCWMRQINFHSTFCGSLAWPQWIRWRYPSLVAGIMRGGVNAYGRPGCGQADATTRNLRWKLGGKLPASPLEEHENNTELVATLWNSSHMGTMYRYNSLYNMMIYDQYVHNLIPTSKSSPHQEQHPVSAGLLGDAAQSLRDVRGRHLGLGDGTAWHLAWHSMAPQLRRTGGDHWVCACPEDEGRLNGWLNGWLNGSQWMKMIMAFSGMFMTFYHAFNRKCQKARGWTHTVVFARMPTMLWSVILKPIRFLALLHLTESVEGDRNWSFKAFKLHWI